MYQYVLANEQETQEFALASPPSEFMQGMSAVMSFFGFDLNTVPVIVYAREEGEGAWQPILGTDDKEPVLFPMLAANKPKPLEEKEYYEIGHKALGVYDAMRKKWMDIKKSGYKKDKHVRQILDVLQSKMLEIESVVAGTEYEKLFDLKFKQKKNNDACAMALYIAGRTVQRNVDRMAVYIGQILIISMKPRKLQELLDWMEPSHQRDAKKMTHRWRNTAD